MWAMLMEAINRSMGPIGGQDLSRDALVLMVKKSDKSRLKTLLVHPAQDLSRSLRRASRVLFYDRCAPCLYTANILLLQDIPQPFGPAGISSICIRSQQVDHKAFRQVTMHPGGLAGTARTEKEVALFRMLEKSFYNIHFCFLF